MDFHWYKNKHFWLMWSLHVLVVSVLAWVFAGPVFRITLTNGGLMGNNSQMAFFLFAYLIGIWGMQLLALFIYPTNKQFLRWFIILSTYINIGLPIAITLFLINRLKVKSKIVRWVAFFLLCLLFWKIIQELFALYTILITEFYFAS